MKGFWEVPSRTALATLLLLFISVCSYDIATRPPLREVLVGKVLSSVVEVHCRVSSRKKFGSSGFVVSKYGHIITTAHSIAPCKRSQIRVSILGSAAYYKVSVLKRSKLLDVAILQVPTLPKSLVPLELDTSLYYPPGLAVILIGNPLEYSWTVSAGMISAERLYSKMRIIQITAPVIPGNSGGPVFNRKGKVVGMAVGYNEESYSLSFMVPGNTLQTLLNEFTK